MGVYSTEGALFPGMDVRLEQVTMTAGLLLIEVAVCGPTATLPRLPGSRSAGFTASLRGQ
ncbi:hypothetical protein AB0D12_17900 [Streptomyces sp. NPDC048479]|uniref:hypothetical protein n=1 Tax=Streptomyces sp. NPDC048479 TaxID=3154725 RepID=UPI003429880B